jgi:hypothetical protein
LEDRVGKIVKTKNFGDIEIVEYINSKNCTIKFSDNTIVKNRSYSDVLRGNIRNPYKITVHGVGFLGEGTYNKISYNIWFSMFSRCYGGKQATYEECLISQEWNNYQNFNNWFTNNYIQDFQLDKDILVKGNKIYSPETCCFVPHEINSLFTRRTNKRGIYPIGVSSKRDKFQANINIEKTTKYLGIFDTPEEAFEAYKIAKEKHIKEVANKWKNKINTKVYQALIDYKVEIND